MTNLKLMKLLSAAVVMNLGLLTPAAWGANLTWSGGGTDNNWGNSVNWSGTSPATGDNLTFNGSTRLSNTNNLVSLTNGWVRFNNGNFVLGGNSWSLNPSGSGMLTNLAGTNILAMNLALIPAAKYWAVSPNSEVRLAGVVTNTSNTGTSSGWLCLTNGGVVRILNSAKSTRGMDLFQGTVIVDGGLVDAGSDGIRFKPPTGSTAAVQIINNGSLRIGGGGNFRMGHNGTAIGAIAGPGSLSLATLDSGTLELYGTAVSVLVGDLVAGATAVFNQNGGLVWGSAGSGNTLTIGGVVNADGTYNLNGGTLWIAQVRQGNVGATNVVFNFNGGTLRPTASSTTFFQGLLNANVQNGGAIIDTTNFNITIAQNLAAAGTGGLTKLGSGTLILSGNSTYTGNTVVSNGTLSLVPNALLGGGGMVVADTGILSLTNIGAPLSVSALAMGPGTSTLRLTLLYGNSTPAAIMAGNVSASGTATINIVAQGLVPGQFPLIQFTSASGLGNFRLGSLPPGVSATLVQTATTLDLNVSSAVKQLFWSGAANNQWDTASTNWVDLNNANNPTNYSQAAGAGDMVTFDDSATGPTNINLGLAVSPVLMTLNNNTFPYTFAGTGKLTGVTSLTKNGFQTATLGTVNDYTNGTTLNSGSLFVDADQALGLGPVTLNLGTLACAGITGHTLPNTLILNADTGIVLGDLVNTGTLTLPGKLDLAGGAGRTLTLNSDLLITGGLTNGGFTTKTGPGRLLLKGNSQQGALVTQQQGDVIIDGARLDNLNGWRVQNMSPGTTLRLVVTNGGVFTMNLNSGNVRVGLAGGDNSSDNVLDISGTVDLTPTAALTGNSAVSLGLSGANAYLYLRAGGLLVARATTGSAPANSEVHFSGGTLRPIADEPGFLTGLTSAFVENGGVTIDTTNFNVTIPQSLLAGGSGGLTKAGAGSLTLTGTNTYTGQTLVNAGKLILGPAHTAPGSISIVSNATLAFLSSAPGLTVSVPTVVGADGSALEAQFTGLSSNPTNPAGVVNAIVLNGTVGANLMAANITAGQFPLFGYNTISGAGKLVVGQLPHGVLATLVTNTSAKTIDLVVSSVLPLLWTGATNGNWDTSTTNWTVSGSATPYAQGDNVRLDDSASNPVLTMTLALTPGAVTVSNSALAYQLNASGAGSLGGNMSLVKDGTNNLTLNSANTFLGAVTVKAGTLTTANAIALGATNGATTVLNGATLDVSGKNLDSEPVVLVGSGVGGRGALVNASADQNDCLKDVTLTGDTVIRADATLGIRTLADTDPGFRGNGYKLTKVGSNQVNLNGGQTNPGSTIWDTDLGDVNILEGTLSFQRRMTMGRAANKVTVAPGATLLLFALNTTMPLQVKPVYLTNATLSCNGNNATDSSTFGGPVTLSVGSNFFSTFAGTTLTLNGPIQGPGSVYSSGLVVYGGTNTYTGSSVVSSGTLQLGPTALLTGSTNISVQPGATFDVSTVGTWTLGANQTLSGFGTVNGSVQANGTVSPGASIGTLTFNNNLVLAGTTVMELNKDGGLTNDVLAVTGALTYGGHLNLVLTGSTPLAVNDSFKLFNFPGTASGSFALSLPAGYNWDTSLLSTSGTIRVASLASPPQINNVFLSGGNLTFAGSGGTGGATYYVYSSTNITQPVGSWLPVMTNSFASDGKFTNTFPVNPSEAKRFFVLKSQ